MLSIAVLEGIGRQVKQAFLSFFFVISDFSPSISTCSLQLSPSTNLFGRAIPALLADAKTRQLLLVKKVDTLY
jgi:hypothetical protein